MFNRQGMEGPGDVAEWWVVLFKRQCKQKTLIQVCLWPRRSFKIRYEQVYEDHQVLQNRPRYLSHAFYSNFSSPLFFVRNSLKRCLSEPSAKWPHTHTHVRTQTHTHTAKSLRHDSSQTLLSRSKKCQNHWPPSLKVGNNLSRVVSKVQIITQGPGKLQGKVTWSSSVAKFLAPITQNVLNSLWAYSAAMLSS